MVSHTKDPKSSRIIPAIPIAYGGKRKTNQLGAQKPASKAELDASSSSETGKKTPVDAPLVENSQTPPTANGVLTPTSNISEFHEKKVPSKSETPELESAPEPPAQVNPVEEAAPEPETHTTSELDNTPPAATTKLFRALPPPFYPAQPTSSHSSVASMPNRHDAQFMQPTMHQARPSANNLVFGSYRNSNNSSPAVVPPTGLPPPPPAPGPHATAFIPPPGPSTSTFVPPPPFIPAGHSYHYSEPQANQHYPHAPGPSSNTYSYPRDNPNYIASPHYAQSRQYYSPNSRFRQPGSRQEEYSLGPRYSPQIPYYHHPHSGRFPDPNFTRPGLADQRRVYEQDSTLTEQPRKPNDLLIRLSGVSLNEDLASYLGQQFGNVEFADCVLELSHSSHLFNPVTLPVHGILLARSPKLRSLMAMQHSNPSTFPKPLVVIITDKFMNREDAFVTALKRLYGAGLLHQDSGPRAVVDFMRLALAYAAAGHFLQVDEIITRGLDIATRLLSWETVEMALAFSLDGGLSFSWNSIENNEDKGSTSSFEDAKVDSPASAPTYGIYSERLLNGAVQFLITNFPSSFKLSHSTSINGKSRFSQIRFGEMTSEDQASNPSDSIMTTISSILGSLPFPVLKYILENHTTSERLGTAAVADTMRAVVEEREQRRRSATKPHGVTPTSNTFEDRLPNSSRWVEKVEQSEQSAVGFILTRHRSTADTPPPSSDSTKS